jgi:DNA-binding SARP family transcriptional activator/DNA-binding beta-propeller fold protein YncE
VDIGILGSLEIRDHDGRELRLPTGRERTLFLLLVLSRGQVVSNDRIVDALWSRSPPGTATKAVQGYVSHLRRLLESAATGVAIETRAPGYVLGPTGINVDADRFEELAAGGLRALEDDAPAEARDRLDAALALWRGPALADVAYEDFAQHEARRLDELRARVREDRAESLLRLGRHAELIAELEALVASHPLRERLRGQLMLALYRTGRQSDALSVYRELRRHLAGELGLDPGPELQKLERAILAQDPSLEPPDARGVEATPAAPRQTRAAPTNAPVPPDSVAVIDPQRSVVVGHVPVGRRPVAVAVGHGSVWVANADDGTVSRIDPDRGEVIRTIGIGAPAIDLAVATDAVWVANGSDGTVSRIDPNADAVVSTVDLRGTSDLVWNPAYGIDARHDSVWVAVGPRHVFRLDPTTDEPAAVIDVGSVPAGLALGEDALWVVGMAGRAMRIEPHTNTATAEVPIGYPVAVAIGEEAVWVSDIRGQVWRIHPDTASVIQTTLIGRGLVGLCEADGMVFAANNADGTIAQIEALGGRIVDRVFVGNAPTDVAVRDGAVWASVQSDSAL